MTIANEITNYANGLSDAYGAVNDMGGVIPQDKNMNNLDTAIRTIPQTPGGAAVTFFYFDETTHDLYKESTYTTVATITDVLTAYNDGLVVIKDGELNTDIGNEGLTVTAADARSVFCLLTTTGGNKTYDVKYEYDSSQTPKWVRWERTLQRELTAGTGISISAQNVISATGGTPINHLFFYDNSTTIIAGAQLSFYKDAECTQTATFKEVTEALRDGGFTLMTCVVYEGAIEEGEIWQSLGGYYTENCDEGINEIMIARLDGYTSGIFTVNLYPYEPSAPPYNCGNEDVPAVYVPQSYPVLIDNPGKRLAFKSNDNGTYSFYSRTIYMQGYTQLKFIDLVNNIDDYDVDNLKRQFVRYSSQSVQFPNVYQNGYFVTKVNSQSPAIKELYAIATKIENSATQTVLLKVTAANDNDTDIILTETTFDQAFTGATSLANGTSGLVPAPTTSDPDKFLKGDGTWGAINDCTTFYVDGSVTANGIYSLAMDGYRQYTLYKDDALTVAATALEFWDAFEKGSVKICALLSLDGYYDDYVVTARICNDSETDEAYYQIGSPYGYDAGGIRFMIAVDTTLNTVYFTKQQYVQIMSGASASSNGAVGVVPAPAAGDQEKVLHGDGTWKDTTAKLVEMSYGEANAWTKFINAYNAGSIVYCRASSNANPATGSQTRKAFMAYVNNAASPTSVEFQYVRSVSSKTEAQPVDQVFVYTLTNANGGTWSVASRNMGPKIAAGTGISVSYSNGTYTISLA